MTEPSREGRFICDMSGFDFPRGQAVKNWDGAMVHRRFADVRNPQDFVTGRRDNEALPWSRPEADDTFLTTNQVTAAGL